MAGSIQGSIRPTKETAMAIVDIAAKLLLVILLISFMRNARRLERPAG